MSGDPRLMEIRALRAEGHSYQAIGERYGITRQRVWAMVNETRARRDVRALVEASRDDENAPALRGEQGLEFNRPKA